MQVTQLGSGYMPLRFGTNNRGVQDDGYDLDHYSYFFRGDMDWDLLFDDIDSRFGKTNPVPMFYYACADGSEPWTIALKLIIKHGAEQAQQRFFPIQASDKMPEITRNAKKGAVILTNRQVTEAKRLLQETPYTFHDFFELADESDFPPERVSDRPYAPKSKFYKIKGVLKGAVAFNPSSVDLTEVAKQTGKRSPFKEPCVVFFRNAWPYVEEDKQYQLARDLYNQLPSGSMVVCGDYDLKDGWASEALSEAGFTRTRKPFVIIGNWVRRKRFNIRGGLVQKTRVPKTGVFIKP